MATDLNGWAAAHVAQIQILNQEGKLFTNGQVKGVAHSLVFQLSTDLQRIQQGIGPCATIPKPSRATFIH